MPLAPPVGHEPTSQPASADGAHGTAVDVPATHEGAAAGPLAWVLPARDEPVRDEPVRDEPVRDEPVRDQPVRDEPVRDEPVGDEPVRDQPVRDEPQVPVGATEADSGRRGGRNLPVAVAVGVVLAALLGAALVAGPAWFTALITAVMVVAVWEAGTQLATTQHLVARPVLVVAAIVMGVATHALGVQGQVLGLLVLVLGAFSWELSTTPRSGVVGKLGTTLLLGVWVVFLGSFGILLVNRDSGAVGATLAVAGGAIVGDIGAYAVGRTIGRHRIAPNVSPNKTWEGLIGGLVTSAVAAGLLLPLVDGDLFADPLDAAFVAAIAALAGFFGDLAESMVKRDVGLKDLGSLLPGHGGMLDRVDALLLALPVGYYALELLT